MRKQQLREELTETRRLLDQVKADRDRLRDKATKRRTEDYGLAISTTSAVTVARKFTGPLRRTWVLRGWHVPDPERSIISETRGDPDWTQTLHVPAASAQWAYNGAMADEDNDLVTLSLLEETTIVPDTMEERKPLWPSAALSSKLLEAYDRDALRRLREPNSGYFFGNIS